MYLRYLSFLIRLLATDFLGPFRYAVSRMLSFEEVILVLAVQLDNERDVKVDAADPPSVRHRNCGLVLSATARL